MNDSDVLANTACARDSKPCENVTNAAVTANQACYEITIPGRPLLSRFAVPVEPYLTENRPSIAAMPKLYKVRTVGFYQNSSPGLFGRLQDEGARLGVQSPVCQFAKEEISAMRVDRLLGPLTSLREDKSPGNVNSQNFGYQNRSGTGALYCASRSHNTSRRAAMKIDSFTPPK